MTEQPTKVCRDCHKEKTLDRFYRAYGTAGSKDGYINPCKDCRREQRYLVGLKMIGKPLKKNLKRKNY